MPKCRLRALWRKRSGCFVLLVGVDPSHRKRGAGAMIRAIKFVSIPTRDQQRALDFYTQALGFRVVTDQPFGEQRWIELRIPGADTGVVLFTPPGQEDRIGGFMNLSFASDDVAKT